MDNVPIMEVYDQEKMVHAQNANIKQIRKEAEDLNNLAINIKSKLGEQDLKLDDLNKELNKNLIHVEKSVVQLKKADKRSSKNTNKLCCTLVLMLVALSFVALLFYVLFFMDNFDDEGTSSNNR